MPDDLLSVEDIAVAGIVGADEGVWDGSQQPPWRLTWTAKACVPLALGIAECLADFAVPYEET